MISHLDSPTQPAGLSEWVESIQQSFSPKGILSSSPDFEFRPEQQHMAIATAQALEENSSLIVEAGTGVGKSLAYLIPAVEYALAHGKKAVISTHTINLQEQLMFKDIPLVRKILKNDFTAALLKGRGNYLCTGRLMRAMQLTGDLFSSGEEAELQRLFAWSQKTLDGTLSDLDFSPDPKVWAQICSEPHICTARTCGVDSRCFYQQAKRLASEASVIVLNHTLFFGLLAQADIPQTKDLEDSPITVTEEGFIFPNDFVILDEAHTIENIAAQQLGLKISQYDLRHNLGRLYNNKTRKGILVTGGNPHAIEQATELYDAIELFFDDVREQASFDKKGNIIRIRRPEFVENILSQPLINLSQSLIELAEDADNDITKMERKEAARRLYEYHNGIKQFLEQEDDSCVYWAERSGQEGKNVSLLAAPIEVADKLRQLLFQRNNSVILTSATLSTGENNMNYFCQRTGSESARRLQVGSPFDFEKQMRLLVSTSIPEPNTPDYKEKLVEWIQYALEESQGRAFVLFTSYKLMVEMGAMIKPFCEEQDWDFFIQGNGISRGQLLDSFKKSGKGVLFGTDSFWTGVDVPGEALSHVIITRLPFDVPDHPLIEARLEVITQRNGKPFLEYSVPEAILKLRQGIGRLIRTKKDTGIVTILDSRISKKFYGKLFLQALPPARREFL